MKTGVSGKRQKSLMEAKQQIQILLASPAAMKELIQYFETHGRLLDRQELGEGAAPPPALLSADSFVSCIRFNGTPILPPVMTKKRVEETREDRHKAVFREKRLKARQRKHLMEVAHQLVENTEAAVPPAERGGGLSNRSAPPSGISSRLPLDRPSVLRPVVTTAWGSVTASAATPSSSVQSLGSTATDVTAASSRAAHTYAMAEQGGGEDFGLQTLDSQCSDFMSMEETLPTDFNGVPFTSVRQQKISHDLLRLSKILKVKDLNSTGESTSELPLSEVAAVGDSRSEERGGGGGGGGGRSWMTTPALDNVSASFFHESQDTVVEVGGVTPPGINTTDNNTSGFVDNSLDGGSPLDAFSSSPQGDGHSLSGGGSTNTSGMSSANTTGTTDSHRSSSRSSPRSLKKDNTVHFASFVTEYIDTSASLSSENITVVKKKLPADQRKAGGGKQGGKGDVAVAVAGGSSQGKGDEERCGGGGGEDGGGLLNNVSLSESDCPVTPTPTSNPATLPFQTYLKVEPSSSDKENDAKQANKLSGGGGGGAGTTSNSGTHRPSSHHKSSHPQSQSQSTGSVTDSQGSSRSDATAATSESSNSTLIEEAAATAASRDSVNSLPLNIVDDGAGAAVRDDREKKNIAPAPGRKPKKLPPEPPQSAYQHPSRHVKVVNSSSFSAKGSSNETTAPAPSEGHVKGHVRRGSYTLQAPSPALVRSQAMSPVGVGVDRGEEARVNKKLNYEEEEEDGSKPLNIPLPPAVPSEPESAGKAEHINKYLSQVQLHASEDLTASQMSADLSVIHSTVLSRSQAYVGSAGGGGGQAQQEFESLRHNLMEHQQKELEELFIQQRREQMSLQNEIEEHHHRMKEQQDFLVSNAPENIKVQSQSHNGELSPDSNTGEETGVKRFNFPHPKQSQMTLQGQTRVGGAASPGSLLLNSSPSSSSPRVRRPVLRSPVKFHPGRRNLGRVHVPPEAYAPEMRDKFEKLTAAAKGFLTRCLLQTDKVQELIKTIKDTREFAFSFQSETPIRKGNFSSQDRTLLERIVAQLQAALLDVHEIFFETPVEEQMGLIEQTRLNNREKRLKSSTEESVRSSAPRISTATLKAQERRRRAQEAESTVFGASSARPRTAPPAISSPRSRSSVDLSGPLKRHFQSLLSKAMKPGAMQASHLAHQAHPHPQMSAIRPDNSARSEKNRPQTAPERSASSRPKKPVSASVAASNPHFTENAQPKFIMRLKQQPSQQALAPTAATKQSSKLSAKASSSKSWR